MDEMTMDDWMNYRPSMKVTCATCGMSWTTPDEKPHKGGSCLGPKHVEVNGIRYVRAALRSDPYGPDPVGPSANANTDEPLRSDSPVSERCERCYRKMSLRCVVCDHTDRVYRNVEKLQRGPASTGGERDDKTWPDEVWVSISGAWHRKREWAKNACFPYRRRDLCRPEGGIEVEVDGNQKVTSLSVVNGIRHSIVAPGSYVLLPRPEQE